MTADQAAVGDGGLAMVHGLFIIRIRNHFEEGPRMEIPGNKGDIPLLCRRADEQ